MSVLNQIQTRPEIIDRRLSEGCAVCCEFNRWGSLLAVGCHDGKVIIWDFDVLGVARVLVGLFFLLVVVVCLVVVVWVVLFVVSLIDGSLLAVGCHDGKVIIWDFDILGVARVVFLP